MRDDLPKKKSFRERHREELTPFQRFAHHAHSHRDFIFGKVVTHDHHAIVSSLTVGARFIVKTGYLQVSEIESVTRYRRFSLQCGRSPVQTLLAQPPAPVVPEAALPAPASGPTGTNAPHNPTAVAIPPAPTALPEA